MASTNAFSGFILINSIIFLLLFCNVTCNVSKKVIENWNMYRTTPNMLVFNHPSTEQYVAFQLTDQQYEITWNDGANQIIVGKENPFQIQVRSTQEKVDITIDIHQKQNNKLSFVTNVRSISCIDAFNSIPLEELQQSSFKKLNCTFPLKISNRQSKLVQSWQTILQQHDKKVTTFMQAKKISTEHKILIKYCLKQMYSAITYIKNDQIGINFCLRNTQAQDYYGIYSRPHNNCDRKLALLSLDLLYDFDPQIAKWLYDQFLIWIDNQLRYATYDNRIVQAAQHIESIIKFYPNYNKNSAKNILLSYISNILLKSVSHLEEEINYRQSNQLHPSLLKMMTLSYEAYSPYLKQLSVYHQSFLEDMFYHGNEFSVQLAVVKYCYLVKLATFASYYLNQQATVDAFYYSSHPDQVHAQSAKNTIVQINSLINIIKIFLRPSEDGSIKSVVKDSNDNKLYVSQATYEKFFPHMIGISNSFPNSTFTELLTEHGIASGHKNSLNYDVQNFRYRGRTHLYFNYKILKHQNNEKLKNIWKTIQNDIIQEWNKNKQISTAWDEKRVSKQTQRHLKIVAASFLFGTADKNTTNQNSNAGISQNSQLKIQKNEI